MCVKGIFEIPSLLLRQQLLELIIKSLEKLFVNNNISRKVDWVGSYSSKGDYIQQNSVLSEKSIHYRIMSKFLSRICRCLKPWKPVFHLMYIITISYYLSKKPSTVYNIKKVERFLSDIRHVLLWTTIPGLNEEGQGIFIKHGCSFINCYITTNRSLFGNLGYFDAVLFDVADVSAGASDLPDVRSWTQKYIFVANESSDNYPVCDPIYDEFFNWTWTYK